MKKLQTLKTKTGIECILFPMLNMNISQGVNGKFSHKGDMALDICGKNSGIEPYFMPFTGKLVYKQERTGMVLYESTDKVLWANGTYDYIHFLTLHDNYIGDLTIGKVYPQGCEVGDEGTKGYATGNHVHLVFGRGKAPKGYPLIQNKYGTWVLPKQVDPRDVFFIDGTTVIDSIGYKFKKYSGEDIVIKPKYHKGMPFRSTGLFTSSQKEAKFVPASDLKYGKGDYYISHVYEDGRPYPYEVKVKENTTIIGFANDKVIDDEPTFPDGSVISKKYVILPKTVEKWRVYALDKSPVVGNEKGFVYPSKLGGLTYEIVNRPQKDIVTINTRDYGKVNIYVGPDTSAIFS